MTTKQLMTFESKAPNGGKSFMSERTYYMCKEKTLGDKDLTHTRLVTEYRTFYELNTASQTKS